MAKLTTDEINQASFYISHVLYISPVILGNLELDDFSYSLFQESLDNCFSFYSAIGNNDLATVETESVVTEVESYNFVLQTRTVNYTRSQRKDIFKQKSEFYKSVDLLIASLGINY